MVLSYLKSEISEACECFRVFLFFYFFFIGVTVSREGCSCFSFFVQEADVVLAFFVQKVVVFVFFVQKANVVLCVLSSSSRKLMWCNVFLVLRPEN